MTSVINQTRFPQLDDIRGIAIGTILPISEYAPTVDTADAMA